MNSFVADREALKAFTWYENIRKGLGEDFKIALDSKIELLKINPCAYSLIYKDICATKLKTFPYNIIYRVTNKEIQIISVFHHSRNPHEWKIRV